MCILVASLGSAVQLPLIWFSVSVLGRLVQPLAVQVRMRAVARVRPAAETVRVLIFERHPHTDGFQLCICGHGEGQRAVVHIFNASLGAAPFQRIAFLGGGRHGGARFARLHLLRQRARQRAAVFAVLMENVTVTPSASELDELELLDAACGLKVSSGVAVWRGDGGQRRAAVLGLVGVRAHIVDQRLAPCSFKCRPSSIIYEALAKPVAGSFRASLLFRNR